MEYYLTVLVRKKFPSHSNKKHFSVFGLSFSLYKYLNHCHYCGLVVMHKYLLHIICFIYNSLLYLNVYFLTNENW